MNTKNKIVKWFLICFSLLFVTTLSCADDLYDGFRNPPNSARPFVHWDWSDKNPTEKEIIRQLDTFKEAGFGGVEISPAQNVNAKTLKFAAQNAKKRGLLVDLSLGCNLTAANLQSGESSQIIALGKKPLKGPLTYKAKVKDLIKLADETQNIPSGHKGKLMFLRLIQTDLLSFNPGVDFSDKTRPDGSISFDINDSNNYTLYIGVLHENYVRPKGVKIPLLNPLNKQAVEKYLNSISAKLNSSLHAISCDALDFYGANWTADFNEQFTQRHGYDLTPYLPLVLDFNLPNQRTRFYDTTRRVRFDYCLTLAQLYQERFVQPFHSWCRDNGVLSRLSPPAYPLLPDIFGDFNIPDNPQSEIRNPKSFDPNLAVEINTRSINKIASSVAHLSGKTVVSSELFSAGDDLSFISGANHFIFNCPDQRKPELPISKNDIDRNARLSYLFQNSTHQGRIAILLHTNDLWSDCGPSRRGLADYVWYLLPIWQALNRNGYCADYISEKNLSNATYSDGKLHCGPIAYDAVIIPDAFSLEFAAAKVLRFDANAGGKIAFVGRPPQTAPGFKDLIVRGVPVSLTLDHIRRNDPNRVPFLNPPVKDTNDLIFWTAELMNYLKITPNVRITPVNPDIFFVHYLSDNRDIFFFTNTNKAAAITFSAEFNTGDKTPWIWNPETGQRSEYPYGESKNSFSIKLKPLESILLVFEPNMPVGQPEAKK